MRASALCALLPLLLALTSPARGQDTPPPPRRPGQKDPGKQDPQDPGGKPGQQPGQKAPGDATTPEQPPPGEAPQPTPPPPEVTPGVPPPIEPQVLEPEALPAPLAPEPLQFPDPTAPEPAPGAAGEAGGTGEAGGAPGVLQPGGVPEAVGGYAVEGGPRPAGEATEGGAQFVDPLAPSDLTVDPDTAALDPRRQAAEAEAPDALATRTEERGEALREARPIPAGRTELSGLGGGAAGFFGLADRDLIGQRGLRLTPWLVVAPVLRAEAAYDSNVFRARSNTTDPEESDIELTGSVGLTLVARPTRQVYLALAYSLLYRTFAQESGINSVDHFVRLEGSWTARRWGIGTSLTVADLSRPNDPRFGGAQVGRLSVEGQFSGQVQLHRRIGLRSEQSVQMFDYDDQDTLDQLSFGVNLLVTVQATRTITVLAGAGVREIQYTDSAATNPDLRLFSPVLGMEMRLSQRLVLTLRAGYEIGQITDDRGQTGLEEPAGPVIAAGMSWQITPRWRVSGDVTRQITAAVVGSSQTITRFGAEVRRRIGQRMEAYARGSVELQEPEDSNDDLLALRADGGLDWRIKDWLTIGFYVSYLDSQADQRGDFSVFRAGVVLTLTP